MNSEPALRAWGFSIGLNILLSSQMSEIKRRSCSDWLESEHLGKDLKRKSLRGGLVTALSQAMQFILRIGSTMTLARILNPSDFGMIAMVTALTNFAMMFRDLGLSMATIQQKKISHNQVSNLFWINSSIGVIIACVLMLMAPTVANFYHEPKLILITQVLSVTFIFSGLGVQHKALLQRQMCFTSLGGVTIGGIAAGVVAGIVSALYGAGYWSLVILTITTETVITLLSWIVCSWRPSLPRKRSGTRPLLYFGGNITGFGIVNYFARNLDNILIGRYWGATALGFYSKAYYIMMFPVSQIRVPLEYVAMPALCQLQDDPERYSRYYLILIRLLAFITMPIMALLFVTSSEVIYILLGAGWEESTKIFQVLCFAAFIQPVTTTFGLVFLSLGQSGRFLKFGLANSIFMVSSFMVGIPYGAVGVALSYTIANYIILVPSLWYCFKKSPIKIWGFFSSISRPVIISILMTLILMSIHPLFSGKNILFTVIIMFFISLISYFGLWILVPGGLSFIKEISNYYRMLTVKRS